MKTKKAKLEFLFQTKVGQIVNYIEINIRSNEPKYSSGMYENGIFVTPLKIVYQTESKIALSSRYIPVLDRPKCDDKRESYTKYFGWGYVSVKTTEIFFPNGIFGHIYTLESPEAGIALLKKVMIKKVETDYGFLKNMNIEAVINGFNITTKP